MENLLILRLERRWKIQQRDLTRLGFRLAVLHGHRDGIGDRNRTAFSFSR